ncbi:guanylate-binding protein 7 isoform X2 [Jatropha curcas]|nr:guanylate-binding protein 7 isoform X2 [Jatropha curcas]
MYSTQIFSLAVLLSSLFVYNQVGLIDEAALDHLSLITEMTKHIHGRASKENDSVSELGEFSPVFTLLLRDFYLDLKEKNAKITPRDYLEVSLRPVMGDGKDIAAKNQIRESIRAFFPNRECFALVRPLNDENELQHLDQVSLDKFRPEFLSGLDAFTKFVCERTRPKQVGSTVMTGPFLAGITKSFLDALNNGATSTVSSSWQYSKAAFMEADLQCSNAIQLMENKLQGACLVADARIENVAMVLGSLVSEYDTSVHGPMKWQKLSFFLQKSLQGPIIHHAKKLIDEVSSENSSLMLKCQSLEDKIELLHKQLQANEKLKAECQKCYENAIIDFQKLSDQYKSRIMDLESKCSLLEERFSGSLEMLDSAKQASFEWERKYEDTLTEERTAVNLRDIDKMAVCKSGISEAAKESRLAWKEADEWKEKYDVAFNEAKAAMEKAAQEAMLRQEDLRARFIKILAEKEEEIKNKVAKLEEADQRLTTLTLDLKAAETKIGNYKLELSDLKLQMKELSEKYEFVKSSAQSMEREAQTLMEDRTQLEKKYLSELKRFEEAEKKCKVAEEEVKVANEFTETEQSEVVSIQNEKFTIDRLALTKSADSHIEILERSKMDLAGEVERSTASEGYAMSKVALLEAMVRERDQEIELLKKKSEQYVTSVQILEGRLDSRHVVQAEANRIEKQPSLQLDLMQERLNLQQDLTPDDSIDSAMDSGLKTYSGRKRSRLDTPDVSFNEEIASGTKKSRSALALQKCTATEAESVFKANEEDSEYLKAASASCTKLTVAKLRQELIEHGFGDELQKLRYPKKKDVLALYKKLILKL